jgi:RHS repeat-associated protein
LHRKWSGSAEQGEVDRRFYAIVTDLVGTPAELVTPQGEIAWRASSTLWGRTVDRRSQAADCPLRFPGQYHDEETGLHYNLARYYDAETARYLTPDPLGRTPSPNHHAYVDNPLWWIDPLGLAGKAKDPVRIFDDSTYKKHGRASSASGRGETGRAPTDGQAALDRSVDLDPGNPAVTRRLGVHYQSNEIVVLDRHDFVEDKDGNIVKEIYHGHVQSTYPSKSVTEGTSPRSRKLE